jgi:hypothetical protein
MILSDLLLDFDGFDLSRSLGYARHLSQYQFRFSGIYLNPVPHVGH